jgi:hypothetical protein
MWRFYLIESSRVTDAEREVIDVMTRTKLLPVLILMACFGLPSFADEASASEPPVDPGAGFEESLELMQDRFDRQLSELMERNLAGLEAQRNERLTTQLERSYAMAGGRQIEVIVVRPSRSSSGDALGSVAKRTP